MQPVKSYKKSKIQAKTSTSVKPYLLPVIDECQSNLGYHHYLPVSEVVNDIQNIENIGTRNI